MTEQHPIQPPSYLQQRPETNGANSTIGLVFGVISILVAWIPIIGIIAWVTGGLGLLFSFLGFKANDSTRTMAIVGLAINGVALLICFAYVVFFVLAAVAGAGS